MSFDLLNIVDLLHQHSNLLNVFLGVVGYITVIRLFRYRFLNALPGKYPYHTRSDLKKMSLYDAWDIQSFMFGQEFPFTAEKATQFALFKTYGIPTISKLLAMTKQLSSRQIVGKRYADTVVIVTEFSANEPQSQRTLDAIARLNFIHGKYQARGLISNDDMLYTLSLFALEPFRWINRYEWRQLSEIEICALGVFWKAQGDAMKIDFTPLEKYATEEGHPLRDGGLAWFSAIDKWSLAYEEKAMLPAQSNKDTADRTVDVLLWTIPKSLHPFGRKVVASLMDQRLRNAMMYKSPPSWVQNTVESTLHVRKYMIRYLFPPRPRYFRVYNISVDPDENGRLHLNSYDAEPWYIKDSFWNRYRLSAWTSWLAGLPIPSKPFQPEGYKINEIGPKSTVGKGEEEQAADVERLRAMRLGGCPFG